MNIATVYRAPETKTAFMDFTMQTIECIHAL